MCLLLCIQPQTNEDDSFLLDRVSTDFFFVKATQCGSNQMFKYKYIVFRIFEIQLNSGYSYV